MTGPGKRPTIKDVSELAGVSWKTVSNVMHGRPNVKEATRQRVLAAGAQLGYRASLAGRQLRSGRTNTIALTLPDVEVSYFSQLAHHFIQEADRRGLSVFIYETFHLPERERLAAQGFDVAVADGVVLTPVALDNEALSSLTLTVPLVVLGESVSKTSVDHIAIDSVASAREITLHLLGSGLRRAPFFIGSGPDRVGGTGGLRREGFSSAVIAAGLEDQADNAWPVAVYGFEAGAQAVREILDAGHRPDALLCANDDLALGAMHELRIRGLSVPRDVAVAGWDDAIAGRYSNPTLTTVKPAIDELVDAALSCLVERIEGATPSPREIVVPHTVEERESTRVLGGTGVTSAGRAD